MSSDPTTASTTAPTPQLTVNVTSHPMHWLDILHLIMKLAPLGAAVSATFVPINISQQINASVDLAEQVEPQIEPIIIQIAGIKPPAIQPGVASTTP